MAQKAIESANVCRKGRTGRLNEGDKPRNGRIDYGSREVI